MWLKMIYFRQSGLSTDKNTGSVSMYLLFPNIGCFLICIKPHCSLSSYANFPQRRAQIFTQKCLPIRFIRWAGWYLVSPFSHILRVGPVETLFDLQINLLLPFFLDFSHKQFTASAPGEIILKNYLLIRVKEKHFLIHLSFGLEGTILNFVA